MSPNVFEIDLDRIKKVSFVGEYLCKVFSCYVKEIFVGPVKYLQNYYILGVAGTTG